MTDFCFIRDIENYQHTFDDPKELWARAYDEIGACDALLIDTSDHPSGGRLTETGIAYALRKPVIVVKKHGSQHKALFNGIASTIISYADHKDLTRQLKAYEDEHNFNITDKSTLLLMFLALGAVVSWLAAQVFIPLGAVAAVVYWLVIRSVSPLVRAFDRVIIYIPLTAVWLGGFYLLFPLYEPAALAWAIIYWVVTLFVIRKLKFSL